MQLSTTRFRPSSSIYQKKQKFRWYSWNLLNSTTVKTYSNPSHILKINDSNVRPESLLWKIILTFMFKSVVAKRSFQSCHKVICKSRWIICLIKCSFCGISQYIRYYLDNMNEARIWKLTNLGMIFGEVMVNFVYTYIYIYIYIYIHIHTYIHIYTYI